MKNLLICFAVIFAVALLSGCGSMTPVKVPPNSLSIVPIATSSASKKNVKIVMVDENKRFMEHHGDEVLPYVKGLLDSSNHFGTVTIDPKAAYKKVGDVPKPQDSELVLGVTIKERYYMVNKPLHFGKVLLSIATLTVSTLVTPYDKDNSCHVALSLIREDGAIETYESEAVARRYWSFWSIGQLKTFNAARKLTYEQSMTSALNQLLTGAPTPLVQTSGL